MPDQPPIDDLFAPVKEEAAQPQEVPQESPGVLGTLKDVNNAIGSGIRKAADETVGAVTSFVGGGMALGERATNAVLGTESDIAGELVEGTRDAVKVAGDYKPETAAGAFVEPTAQFITGMIGAGKLLKGAEWFQKSSALAKGFVTGAAADATVFAPNQDRLSNLFNEFAESHPTLRNPLTEFLASKPEDNEAEGRLKNAMEGILAGGLVDRALAGMKGLKAIYYAKETKGNLAAEKVWTEKVLPSLEAEHTKVDSVDGIPKAEKPPLKPDDTADYDAGVQGPNAPLLAPEAKARIVAAIKDNPDWLSEGFVNTKGSGFNFTKMDSPDGAKLAMEELAKEMPTPKVISFKEMVADAKDLGVDVADILNSGKITNGDITKTLLAGKALMQSTARQVADLARGIERNPGNKAELDKALQRFANVQTSVKSLQSDAARATAAGRIRTADSFSEAELKAIQAAGGDLGAITKMISEPPLWVRVMNAHNSYWINSLLSGPTTHVRNIISNTLQSIALPAERIMGGVATGNIEAIKNGAHIALGLASSLKDAIRLAVKASGLPDVAKGARNGEPLAALKKSGMGILDPGNIKLGSETGPGKAISTEAFPSLKGTHAGTALDYLGEAANVPSRFLTTADEFFKQVNYRAQVHADAFIEGQKQGLKGKDLSEYISDRVGTSMTDEGAALNKRALDYARTATFTNKPEPGSFLSWLESGTTNHPYLKLVLPFVRTPANILKNAGLRTPGLNLLSKNYREALSGVHGAEAKADAAGKMMTGGALIGSAVTLALEGAITGKGPADPRERQLLLDTGWLPYSFKVNGTYISYNGFDPMSMFFGIAGDYAEASAHMDQEGFNSASGSFLVATVKNITSKTYLTGLSQVMDALTSPEKSGEAFIKSRAASYVPSGFKQMAGLIPGASDPYLRETRSIYDAILNRLPGFSQSLPPKRNMFGEATTARQALGPDSISPFYYSAQKDDKAAEELARFSTVFAPPAQTIGTLDLTKFKNAKGQDFYDRQQEQLTTLRVGRYTLKEALEALVTSDRYSKWRENEPDALAVGEDPRTLKEVRAVIVRYREEAHRKTQQEFPEVQGAIRAQKTVGRKASAGVAIPEELQQLLQINQ